MFVTISFINKHYLILSYPRFTQASNTSIVNPSSPITVSTTTNITTTTAEAFFKTKVLDRFEQTKMLLKT